MASEYAMNRSGERTGIVIGISASPDTTITAPEITGAFGQARRAKNESSATAPAAKSSG